MDNLRTVKKEDLENFVEAVFIDYDILNAIDFKTYSFYFEFWFSLPGNDSNLRDRLKNAFSELYKRKIIAEEPMQKFNDYKTDYKIHEMFVHPFNVVENKS